MVSRDALKRIAKTRLGDAKILLKYDRPDGASYLCGYAVEVALKARICQFRKWDGQPETEEEDPSYRHLMTHSFERLVQMTGAVEQIKGKHYREWSILLTWRPEARYYPIGNVTKSDAEAIIQATEVLLKAILP